MPKGRAAKRDDILHSGLPLVPYERVARSMMATIDEELTTKGNAARQKILSRQDDNISSIQRLADGIMVQAPLVTKNGMVCHNCGEPVTDVVYRVPPYWPALRWLTDWNRQIIREAPARLVEHTVDPVALEAMRAYLDSNENPRDIPEVNDDGVIDLNDDNPN